MGLHPLHLAFIAALDDDDVWFPDKLSVQMERMLTGGYAMSATEALIGDGPLRAGREYPVYHREFYAPFCRAFGSDADAEEP